LDSLYEEASQIYSTAPPAVIIRDPPPRRRAAGEEQMVYERRMFQTASGHALVALGILAQEILREEISQDKGGHITSLLK
jgi:hypothetical protein